MRGWLARSLLRTMAPMVTLRSGRGGDLETEIEVSDVDEDGGVFDAVLHEVDEVGASAEELRVGGGDGLEGFSGCGGAMVGEGIHAEAPDLVREAARTAATMLG